MTPLFPAQRAAEEFDQVLAGTADAAVAARYAELLDTVAELRALPEVSPSAEFVGDLRSRLMTAAETELAVTPAVVTSLPRARAHSRRRRLGTVAASLVVVGGTAGMAAAASGALPGDGLYPVKRGIEQVTTAIRINDASEGRALLDQAATRLDEVAALEAQGSADPDVIAQTLADFTNAADAGSSKLFTSYQATGDQSDIASVRDFTATQMTDIDSLSAGADTATEDGLLEAADTLATIDEQARVLCSTCAPGQPVLPPDALSAGAAASSMRALIARPSTQAQADIDALAAQIAALQERAEKSAGEIPKVTTSTGTTPALPGNPKRGEPVTSSVTPDGTLVHTVTSGKAVDDLVNGVTGTLPPVVDEVTPDGTPLDETGKKVEDTVDGLTEGLLP